MKIKTFEFRVSFQGGTIQNHILKEASYNDYYTGFNNENLAKKYGYSNQKLYSESEIDEAINSFIKNLEVIDIKINSETLHRHNNAACDSIIRIYTVFYK